MAGEGTDTEDNADQAQHLPAPGDEAGRASVRRPRKRIKWTKTLKARAHAATEQLGGVEGATPESLMGLLADTGLTFLQVKCYLQRAQWADEKSTGVHKAAQHASTSEDDEDEEEQPRLGSQQGPAPPAQAQHPRLQYPSPHVQLGSVGQAQAQSSSQQERGAPAQGHAGLSSGPAGSSAEGRHKRKNEADGAEAAAGARQRLSPPLYPSLAQHSFPAPQQHQQQLLGGMAGAEAAASPGCWQPRMEEPLQHYLPMGSAIGQGQGGVFVGAQAHPHGAQSSPRQEQPQPSQGVPALQLIRSGSRDSPGQGAWAEGGAQATQLRVEGAPPLLQDSAGGRGGGVVFQLEEGAIQEALEPGAEGGPHELQQVLVDKVAEQMEFVARMQTLLEEQCQMQAKIEEQHKKLVQMLSEQTGTKVPENVPHLALPGLVQIVASDNPEVFSDALAKILASAKGTKAPSLIGSSMMAGLFSATARSDVPQETARPSPAGSAAAISMTAAAGSLATMSEAATSTRSAVPLTRCHSTPRAAPELQPRDSPLSQIRPLTQSRSLSGAPHLRPTPLAMPVGARLGPASSQQSGDSLAGTPQPQPQPRASSSHSKPSSIPLLRLPEGLRKSTQPSPHTQPSPRKPPLVQQALQHMPLPSPNQQRPLLTSPMTSPHLPNQPAMQQPAPYGGAAPAMSAGPEGDADASGGPVRMLSPWPSAQQSQGGTGNFYAASAPAASSLQFFQPSRQGGAERSQSSQHETSHTFEAASSQAVSVLGSATHSLVGPAESGPHTLAGPLPSAASGAAASTAGMEAQSASEALFKDIPTSQLQEEFIARLMKQGLSPSAGLQHLKAEQPGGLSAAPDRALQARQDASQPEGVQRLHVQQEHRHEALQPHGQAMQCGESMSQLPQVPARRLQLPQHLLLPASALQGCQHDGQSPSMGVPPARQQVQVKPSTSMSQAPPSEGARRATANSPHTAASPRTAADSPYTTTSPHTGPNPHTGASSPHTTASPHTAASPQTAPSHFHEFSDLAAGWLSQLLGSAKASSQPGSEDVSGNVQRAGQFASMASPSQGGASVLLQVPRSESSPVERTQPGSQAPLEGWSDPPGWNEMAQPQRPSAELRGPGAGCALTSSSTRETSTGLAYPQHLTSPQGQSSQAGTTAPGCPDSLLQFDSRVGSMQAPSLEPQFPGGASEGTLDPTVPSRVFGQGQACAALSAGPSVSAIAAKPPLASPRGVQSLSLDATPERAPPAGSDPLGTQGHTQEPPQASARVAAQACSSRPPAGDQGSSGSLCSSSTSGIDAGPGTARIVQAIRTAVHELKALGGASVENASGLEGGEGRRRAFRRRNPSFKDGAPG